MALIDIDGDPWLREHEACETLFREIAAQLSERERAMPKSVTFAQLSASIRVRLRQFSTEVQQLREKLAVIARNRTITPDEEERRIRLVERLESGDRQLNHRFQARDTLEEASRSQLMTSKASSSKVFADMGTTSWGDDPEEFGAPFDVARVQQTHQQIIKEQDAGLEELAKVISRQKAIAQTIGDEVEVQNEILDDLADGIDSTTVGLINETRQVRVITKKDTTWGYWLVIILLFIAIIIVAVI